MTERHSLKVLNQLYEYDSFLDSLRTICDMGCGTGEDIHWWATLTTRDEPPIPHNYKCFAVERDPAKLAAVPNLPNIVKIEKDFSSRCLPGEVDFIWSHDSLQYSINPLETLRMWNEQMNVNGMLSICVPQFNGVEHDRYYSRSYSGCYYNFTPLNLIYMLAVNGFDCRDAYLLKQFNDKWIHVAVYKSNVKPMDPATTTWVDLIDTGLLNASLVDSIIKNGYVRQEEVLYPWLDRENYYIEYVSTWTEVPESAGDPVIEGVFNTQTQSSEQLIKQGNVKYAGTKTHKPVGLMRPPKKYD